MFFISNNTSKTRCVSINHHYETTFIQAAIFFSMTVHPAKYFAKKRTHLLILLTAPICRIVTRNQSASGISNLRIRLLKTHFNTLQFSHHFIAHLFTVMASILLPYQLSLPSTLASFPLVTRGVLRISTFLTLSEKKIK